MFVDASVLVAILLEEEEGEGLSAKLEAGSSKMTSPIAIYETTLAISRVHRREIDEAEKRVRLFVEWAAIAIKPIGEQTASLALQAHARYGKGRHPARLNLGDCFAYAMAKQHGVPLLYKGDDFALTDLA